MSNRHIYQALSELARRVDGGGGDVEKQLKRLSREIYKTNTLTENQQEQMQTSLETLQRSVEELTATQQQLARQASQNVLKEFLPVLDSIEAGLKSGVAQIKALPADAAKILGAWLNGQRLLRQRLLKLLEQHGIQPVPTTGHAFDPNQHIAVKTAQVANQPDGVILAVERAGYVCDDRVIRYAEVIVNKNPEG